jgi:hypothetical protein
MGIAENRRNKVAAIVQPELEAGEQIVATIGQSQTGPTPWFFLITYFIIFWIRYWALVLTDRRVIFVKCSTWTGGPRAVDHSVPRDQVKVLEFRTGTVWSKLTLQAGPETLKLNVPRISRDDATAFVQALGGAVSAA